MADSTISQAIAHIPSSEEIRQRLAALAREQTLLRSLLRIAKRKEAAASTPARREVSNAK